MFENEAIDAPDLMEWSGELKELFDRLSDRQRFAIVRIVTGMAKGHHRGQMLKRSRSCPYCGRRPEQRVRQHIEACRVEHHGEKFVFAAPSSSFDRWMKNPDFKKCLELATEKFHIRAMSDARNVLVGRSVLAAEELIRQIIEGSTDAGRLRAALGLLDRIGLSPAAAVKEAERKSQERMVQPDYWLNALRDVGANREANQDEEPDV